MALNADMSSFVNLKIFDELAKCCDAMNLNGADRKVYEMCMDDFWHYIGFLQRNYVKVEEENLTNPSIMEFHINQYVGVISFRTYMSGQESKDIDEFVHMFVQRWWRKYHERCKIVFNTEREPLKTLGEFPVKQNFTQREQNEICEVVTDAYIKNGEICCSSILADQMFKRTVESSRKKVWKPEDKINLVSQLTREAKYISYTHGTLIFIKAGKDFYAREWRDDENSNKIV